jgi:hypothetical protein
VVNFPSRREDSTATSCCEKRFFVPITIKAKAAVAKERATEPPKLIFPAIVIALAERRIASAKPKPK